MNGFAETVPDEKALRIRKAVQEALIENGATNQHAFDALSVCLVGLLRSYPLGMREAYCDMFFHRVVDAAFKEVIADDGSREGSA